MNLRLFKQIWQFIVFLFFLVQNIRLTAQVKISKQECVIPTYKVNPPDKNQMFLKSEYYQGDLKFIYPYGLNDMISNEKEYNVWKAFILENEYIKLGVKPEIGGILYYGIDKTNGYNFI